MWKGDRARMEEGGDVAEEGPVRYRSGEKLEESALPSSMLFGSKLRARSGR